MTRCITPYCFPYWFDHLSTTSSRTKSECFSGISQLNRTDPSNSVPLRFSGAGTISHSRLASCSASKAAHARTTDAVAVTKANTSSSGRSTMLHFNGLLTPQSLGQQCTLYSTQRRFQLADTPVLDKVPPIFAVLRGWLCGPVVSSSGLADSWAASAGRRLQRTGPRSVLVRVATRGRARRVHRLESYSQRS